jgi:hypothetical protein
MAWWLVFWRRGKLGSGEKGVEWEGEEASL